MLEGTNCIIFDVETKRSAQDCLHCGEEQDVCVQRWLAPESLHRFEPIGWDRKGVLGLSIGCFWDYQDQRLHFFDVFTLTETLQSWVDRQALLVSFNGASFDAPLLLAQLQDGQDSLQALSAAFYGLMLRGYDILAVVWQADAARKFARGLNSLGALSVANGLGAKEMDGALAPRLWAQGRHAEVTNYVASDVLKTKGLFELIVTQGSILRGDGLPIRLPRPILSPVTKENADGRLC